MEAGTSLVEELVLYAVGIGADLPPSDAQSLDAIARRSGIKCHEVQRVLIRLEEQTPPAVRRIVDDSGATLWAPSADTDADATAAPEPEPADAEPAEAESAEAVVVG